MPLALRDVVPWSNVLPWGRVPEWTAAKRSRALPDLFSGVSVQVCVAAKVICLFVHFVHDQHGQHVIRKQQCFSITHDTGWRGLHMAAFMSSVSDGLCNRACVLWTFFGLAVGLLQRKAVNVNCAALLRTVSCRYLVDLVGLCCRFAFCQTAIQLELRQRADSAPGLLLVFSGFLQRHSSAMWILRF